MAGITREERLRRQAAAAAVDFTPPQSAVATEEIIDPAPVAAVPTFSVAERRLKYGDIAMLSRTADVKLINQPCPMAIWWGMAEDAHEHITVHGWTLVRTNELEMSPERMGLQATPDGAVARGKNCAELLFKMPSHLREEILLRQSKDRYLKRTSLKDFKKRMSESAVADAQDASLTPQQRERAMRQAESFGGSGKKAEYVVLEHKESHSGQPIE